VAVPVLPAAAPLGLPLPASFCNKGSVRSAATIRSSALEDDWVTDVKALRLLDGGAPNNLLPPALSWELQRLVHHVDTISILFIHWECRAVTAVAGKEGTAEPAPSQE
jgi:hypothetical protein